MSSVHTNKAALQALQALNAASKDLTATQARVSTGLKVASVKDNAAIWAIAQGMRADVGGWGAVNQSLGRVQSVLDTAATATSVINDLLVDLRAKIHAYADPSLSATSKSLLREDIDAMIRQIDQQAGLAKFDGVNLITGTGVPGVVLRTPSTSYSLPSSPLTPQSFNTLMHAGSANSSWSSTMNMAIHFPVPYSPLTPDSFATLTARSVSGGASVGNNYILHAGSSTITLPFTSLDDPTRLDFEFDAFVTPDVIEIWQGGQRVAATGQPYVAGGDPVAAGVAASGKQKLSFDYDPDGGPVQIRINEGGAPSDNTIAYYGSDTGPVGTPPSPPSMSPSRTVSASSQSNPPPDTPLTLETSGASAANGVQTHVLDGGANAGRVDLLFDASLTPDVVEIWQNGVRVAASGQPYANGGGAVGAGAPTAGAQVISFDYDPANGQTLEFRFNENNAHPGAAWVVGGLVLQDPAVPIPSASWEPSVSQSVRVGVVDDEDFLLPYPPLTPETHADQSASRTYTINAGAHAGRVDLAFDAYDDADVVEIWRNGVRVAASGQPYVPGGDEVDPGQPVSGLSVISFDYDPAEGQVLEFRFNSGNDAPGAWTVGGIALNDPGDPIPTPSITGGPFSGPHAGMVFIKQNSIRAPDGSQFEISTRNLTAAGLGLAALDGSDPASMVTAVNDAIDIAIEAASYFGSQQKLVQAMLNQNAKLLDTLEAGVGALVDANMAKDSARLQAAQIRQELAVQTLSIANAAPQWLLSLFKA